MKTPLNLAPIKDRLRRATLGPWRADASTDKHMRTWYTITNGDQPVAQLCDESLSDDYLPNARADAQLIAHARQDIEMLVRELESTRKQLVDARMELSFMSSEAEVG
jgi:hypothetical protein